MSQLFSLPTALCLPIPDIEALIQGRTIAALPKMFIRPGQRFALYPVDISGIKLSIEQYYHPIFLPEARAVIKLTNEKVLIKAWAKCELCSILDKTKPLDVLSKLTIWTPEVFDGIIQKQQNLFLAYLRVYHLIQFYELAVNPNTQEKLGKFVSLPNLKVSEDNPVLSNQIFLRRKIQLEKLEPHLNPEWEELLNALAQIGNTNPAIEDLENDIHIFLSWSNQKQIKSTDKDFDWIKTIAAIGDRSIELDEKKTNYQAGTDFENITRRSLGFLGFKVEKDHKGGAGGLDLFCSQPYPLVCECKSGKTIPDNTVEELDRIGKRHLLENYLMAVRLIIGPGKPTKNLKESAKISKISILNPMTLQKLVELKAKYPGSINLFELQKYLEPGQIDHKIDEYIAQVETRIKLRSHIIQLLKKYLEDSKYERAGVEALHAVYVTSNPQEPLESKELHEILIELSSPLTGYVERIKAEHWRGDRFRYLRELAINTK